MTSAIMGCCQSRRRCDPEQLLLTRTDPPPDTGATPCERAHDKSSIRLPRFDLSTLRGSLATVCCFTGPRGCGKTRAWEAMLEVLAAGRKPSYWGEYFHDGDAAELMARQKKAGGPCEVAVVDLHEPPNEAVAFRQLVHLAKNLRIHLLITERYPWLDLELRAQCDYHFLFHPGSAAGLRRLHDVHFGDMPFAVFEKIMGSLGDEECLVVDARRGGLARLSWYKFSCAAWPPAGTTSVPQVDGACLTG